MAKIAFLGAGNLATAFVRGLLAQKTIEYRSRTDAFEEFGQKLTPQGAGFGSLEELLLVPGMEMNIFKGDRIYRCRKHDYFGQRFLTEKEIALLQKI